MEIKHVIDDGSRIIDVTPLSIVLWTFGDNSKRLINDKQIDNIVCVVDRDKNKQKETYIRGRKCNVISPETFFERISLRDCFIIIGSDQYGEEIASYIQKEIGNRYVVCKDWRNFVCLYRNIDECLLYDPILNRKTYEGRCSKLLPECIRIANKMLDKVNGGTSKYYSAFDLGHKLSICIRDEEYKPQFFFQFQTWEEWDWRVSPMQDGVFETIQTALEVLNINKELLIDSKFDSKAKWRAELMYAGTPENKFDEANMAWIIKKIKTLHESGIKINVYINPWTRVDFLRNKLSNRKIEGPMLIEIVDDLIMDECKSYLPVIIHGDLHHGNIISYNNEPFIVDWESLCMSDPMYDISRMIFYLRFYGLQTIDDDCVLSLYFGNSLDRSKKRHYHAMMIFCEYIEYLLQMLSGEINEKLMNSIIDDSKCYKEEFV